MKDTNEHEIIINNQRIIIGALLALITTDPTQLDVIEQDLIKRQDWLDKRAGEA